MLQFINIEWICTVMWGPYGDYSKSAVGYICNVAGIFVQGHLPVMWNTCKPVLLVTLLIAVSSYEVYILK